MDEVKKSDHTHTHARAHKPLNRSVSSWEDADLPYPTSIYYATLPANDDGQEMVHDAATHDTAAPFLRQRLLKLTTLIKFKLVSWLVRVAQTHKHAYIVDLCCGYYRFPFAQVYDDHAIPSARHKRDTKFVAPNVRRRLLWYVIVH